MTTARERAGDFCTRYGLTAPVLGAPMAGACPPELAAAVAGAGGMGAAGVVNDSPEKIAGWAARYRELSGGPFQLNLWVPDAPGPGSGPGTASGTAEVAGFLDSLGGHAAPPAGSAPDFEAQCAAALAARPTAVSSIMGVFDDTYVAALHDAGIAWFACATTLAEALAAQRAGADVVVAQGMEAGGHRGTTDPDAAERTTVGLFALVPQLADALSVPVVAAGAVADGRSLAAALTLGASAVQVGSALLRAPETGIDAGWAAALEGLAPEDTVPTRAYTGRLARAIPTAYVRAWAEPDAPVPARYPQQRRLVARYRAGEPGAVDRVNHWAGQAAGRAGAEPAWEIVARMWRDADALLP
ncbi:NAD(P)H-dependent flavin oxidoreductase [Pseudonocardia nantongensis]|uniref:NAD(P)H-dependent flavin oxidoreductase n=1 Tax=Pseudonocardia nantongensis TaxID=1181885 RepID=UPI00397D5049